MVYVISCLISMFGAYLYQRCAHIGKLKIHKMKVTGVSGEKILALTLMFFPLFVLDLIKKAAWTAAFS